MECFSTRDPPLINLVKKSDDISEYIENLESKESFVESLFQQKTNIGDSVIHICASLAKETVAQQIFSVVPKEGRQKLANSQNKDGETPLHYCCLMDESVGVAELLLKCGADVNVVNLDSQYKVGGFVPVFLTGGRTPLHQACNSDCIEMVELLVENGADVEAKDFDGLTAYDLACLKGAKEVCEYLKPKASHKPPKVDKDATKKRMESIHQMFGDLATKQTVEEKRAMYRKTVREKFIPKDEKLYKALDDAFDERYDCEIDEVAKGIWRLPMMSLEWCKRLIEELDHFENVAINVLNIGVRRPNSMNEYGVVLEDIPQMSDILEQLLHRHIKRLAVKLFGEDKFNSGKLNDHHVFTVRYKCDEDTSLSRHRDDCDVTLNICLGQEFEGGNLSFFDEEGNKTDIEHKVGYALLHAGSHEHQANAIQSGTRVNLIYWARFKKVE